MFKKYYIYVRNELSNHDKDIFCNFIIILLLLTISVLIFLCILFIFIASILVVINITEHLFMNPEHRTKCDKIPAKNLLIFNNGVCDIIASEIPLLIIKFLMFLSDSIFLMYCYRDNFFFNLKLNLFHILACVFILYNYDINIANKFAIILNIAIIIILFVPKNIKKIREKISVIEDDLEAQYKEVEHKKNEDEENNI
jgi:hypothetical protein